MEREKGGEDNILDQFNYDLLWSGSVNDDDNLIIDAGQRRLALRTTFISLKD